MYVCMYVRMHVCMYARSIVSEMPCRSVLQVDELMDNNKKIGGVCSRALSRSNRKPCCIVPSFDWVFGGEEQPAPVIASKIKFPYHSIIDFPLYYTFAAWAARISSSDRSPHVNVMRSFFIVYEFWNSLLELWWLLMYILITVYSSVRQRNWWIQVRLR